LKGSREKKKQLIYSTSKYRNMYIKYIYLLFLIYLFVIDKSVALEKENFII